MRNTHLDWPSGGPTLWLARWEELINKAERYEENLLTWLRDVCLLWEQVPDLIVYFRNIKLSIRKHTTAEYTAAEISSSTHFHWEYCKQRSMLKPVSKPKATRSAFAIQGVTLNGKEVPNVSDTFEVTESGAAIAGKPKTPSKKNKDRRNQKNNRGRNHSNHSSSCDRNWSNRSRSPGPDRSTSRQKHEPCTGCGSLPHNFSKCYLALGQDSDLITNEARKKFQNNMKAASFRKRVDDLKKTPESNADECGSADRGSTKKVMYRVSVLSQFDLNARSPDILLDSATSVHIFNIKEKFSNFKKALKGQGLLCGSNVISIESWGQISLPLK